MKRYLYSDETLFRNRDLFEIDYVPDVFNYREAQLKDIAFALQTGLHGDWPRNIVLRGLPGTGKTTAVRRIFSEVEETTRRLVPVYMNCQFERTKSAIFAKIFQKIHGHLPPSTGAPVRTVINDIGRTLSEKGIVLSVCLDDANYLVISKALNEVLYTLTRLYEEFPGARAGVILTISSMDVRLPQELDPCVLSVLQPKEVYFAPYTQEEISEIHKYRIRSGLFPGVVPDPLCDLIIEQTMRCGDLRVGLELVKQSVMTAARAGRMAVGEDDVLSAYEVSNYVHLSASVRALTTDEKSLLYQIADMATGTESYLTTGAVFEAATENLKMSYTGFYEKIRKFDQMRLVELSHLNHGGRTREIALRYDPERVKEVCG
jgi:cell division control protein 6